MVASSLKAKVKQCITSDKFGSLSLKSVMKSLTAFAFFLKLTVSASLAWSNSISASSLISIRSKNDYNSPSVNLQSLPFFNWVFKIT